MENHPDVNKHLLALAHGPHRAVTTINGHMVNGFMFRTRDSESNKETQNSGVVVMGEVGLSNIEHYGLLREIIEVQYVGGNRVILFKCDWWDVHTPGQGIIIDRFNFVSINPTKKLINDPYVLASQVGQVFYVDDVVKPNWKTIVKTQPRNFYDVPEKNNHDQSVVEDI